MADGNKTNIPLEPFVLGASSSSVVTPSQIPLLMNNVSAAMLSKFMPTMSAVPAVPSQAVAVIPGASQLPVIDGGASGFDIFL